MKQEEKQLLLADLSTRLPYGVKCHFKYGSAEDDITLSCIDNNVARFEYGWYGSFHVSIDADYIKPYLRPMSSMTDEEKNELKQISDDYLNEWENAKTSLEKWKLDAKVNYKNAMFYNSNHLDWNDLTSKGLALQAPEGMYKMEE